MINLNLNEKEVGLIQKSINHCLDTCEDNGKEGPCTDCEALKNILVRLSI